MEVKLDGDTASIVAVQVDEAESIKHEIVEQTEEMYRASPWPDMIGGGQVLGTKSSDAR